MRVRQHGAGAWARRGTSGGGSRARTPPSPAACSTARRARPRCLSLRHTRTVSYVSLPYQLLPGVHDARAQSARARCSSAQIPEQHGIAQSCQAVLTAGMTLLPPLPPASPYIRKPPHAPRRYSLHAVRARSTAAQAFPVPVPGNASSKTALSYSTGSAEKRLDPTPAHKGASLWKRCDGRAPASPLAACAAAAASASRRHSSSRACSRSTVSPARPSRSGSSAASHRSANGTRERAPAARRAQAGRQGAVPTHAWPGQ
jgi:hypothetical protein